METENKDLYDFEKNDENAAAKDKKKNLSGKTSSAAAKAGAAAIAGGATALGAEAAMTLAEEDIIDPEIVAETLEESTIVLDDQDSGHVHQYRDTSATTHQETQPEEVRYSEKEMNAVHELKQNNAQSESEADDNSQEESEADAELAEIVVPDEIEDISEDDLAIIIEGETSGLVTDEDQLPITGMEDDAQDYLLADVEPMSGDCIDGDTDDLSFIDDLV